MSSKDSQKSLTSQSKSNDKKAILRNKLSSIAWVQCDNLNCLKWRKLRKELADSLNEETPWTCDMNEDPNFSRCTVPEEDTSLYDKLAKSVKLDIIKSELKPGSLVWAKASGYCRWPAIVTADPLNGLHFEGDDVEIIWYHVEFLGEVRTHGWVRAKTVEVFGPGNTKENTKSDNYKKTAKKRKRLGFSLKTKERDKKKYKGSLTVERAVADAMSLLPLSFEDRLKTCIFLEINEQKENSISCRDSGKSQQKKVPRTETRGHVLSCVCDNHKTRKKEITALETKRTDSLVRENNDKHHKESMCQAGNWLESPYVSPNMDVFCFEYPTSLLGTSKEERYILDLQFYMRNENSFNCDIIQFMMRNNLKFTQCPVWQNMKVSIYSLFLAVRERKGFLKVCERHQWSAVYMEVAQQPCKQGGSKAKRYYERNLYPYELYVNGLDYSKAISQPNKPLIQATAKETSFSDAGDSGVCTDVKTQGIGDEDFDNPDVIQQLDELDKILQSLENEEDIDQPDGVVPVLGSDIKFFDHDITVELPAPSMLKPMTGSAFGEPDQPEENAQVVPELDFPSSLESSDDGLASRQSDGEHVLYEMQALQHDMDYLQGEIDLL